MTSVNVERLLRKASRKHPNLLTLEERMTQQGRPPRNISMDLRRYLMEALEILEADGQLVSDGDAWHSMDELYDYRMAYHAYAVKIWQDNAFPVVKSWQHHDGENLRARDLFIVTAQLPAGQVSNHYKAKHWDKFDCPEVGRAPQWDGHTPQLALERLMKSLPDTATVLATTSPIRQQRSATLRMPSGPPQQPAVFDSAWFDNPDEQMMRAREGG